MTSSVPQASYCGVVLGLSYLSKEGICCYAKRSEKTMMKRSPDAAEWRLAKNRVNHALANLTEIARMLDTLETERLCSEAQRLRRELSILESQMRYLTPKSASAPN